MGAREDAETALQHALRMQPKFGITGEHQANRAIAKNVLDEEMGRYGEHELQYNLQAKTKDTLLAHARQDAAHGLCNTKSILDQNSKILSHLRMLNFAAALTVIMLAAIVAKLYSQLFPGLH